MEYLYYIFSVLLHSGISGIVYIIYNFIQNIKICKYKLTDSGI